MLAALSTFDAVYWWLVLVFFSWFFSCQGQGTSAFKEEQLEYHRLAPYRCIQARCATVEDVLSGTGGPPGLNSLFADLDWTLGVDLHRLPGVVHSDDISIDTILPVSDDFCLPIRSLVFLLIVTNLAVVFDEILLGLTASASYADLLHMGTQCFASLAAGGCKCAYLWFLVSRFLSSPNYLSVKLGFVPFPLQPLCYLLEPAFLWDMFMSAYWRPPISDVYDSPYSDDPSCFNTWEPVDMPLCLKRALDSLEADHAHLEIFSDAFSELPPPEPPPFPATFYETFLELPPPEPPPPIIL